LVRNQSPFALKLQPENFSAKETFIKNDNQISCSVRFSEGNIPAHCDLEGSKLQGFQLVARKPVAQHKHATTLN